MMPPLRMFVIVYSVPILILLAGFYAGGSYWLAKHDAGVAKRVRAVEVGCEDEHKAQVRCQGAYRAGLEACRNGEKK